MKRIILLVCLLSLFSIVKGQNCIDAIVYKVSNDNSDDLDTMFCRVLNEDEQSYTIDNGYAISSITKNIVKEVKLCVREMTAAEVYKYKGLDQVTQDYFKNANTVGSFFRKAAFSSYFGIGLTVAGTITTVLGATVVEKGSSRVGCVIGGSVATAVGIFFIFRAWNQIYKAGKIMDINNTNAALYFDATPEGNVGFLLKF